MTNISPALHSSALRVAQENPIGSLSTCNTNSIDLHMAPQLSTMMAIIEDDFSFYFLSKTKSRKHYNIESYPTISFVFSDLNTCETLQLEGDVEAVTDPELILHYGFEIRKRTSNRGRAFHPTAHVQKGAVTLYKCTPFWVRYGNFGAYDHDAEDSFDLLRNDKRM